MSIFICDVLGKFLKVIYVGACFLFFYIMNLYIYGVRYGILGLF